MRIWYLNDYIWEYYQSESNNIYDVTIVMLNHVRLSKEYLILDYNILIIVMFIPRLGRD